MGCRFGYYLRSFVEPYPVLAFVFFEDIGPVPCIGQRVEVEGVMGLVDNYELVPPLDKT